MDAALTATDGAVSRRFVHSCNCSSSDAGSGIGTIPRRCQSLGSWPGLTPSTPPPGRWPASGPSRSRRRGARGDLARRSTRRLAPTGLRGLPGGSTLRPAPRPRARAAERFKDLAPLTIPGILRWADAHHGRHGTWPKTDTGPNPGGARRDRRRRGSSRHSARASRGLPGGTTLARLLASAAAARGTFGSSLRSSDWRAESRPGPTVPPRPDRPLAQPAARARSRKHPGRTGGRSKTPSTWGGGASPADHRWPISSPRNAACAARPPAVNRNG